MARGLNILTVIRNKHIANYRNSAIIFNKTSNFKLAIIEMYPRNPWDLFAHCEQPQYKNPQLVTSGERLNLKSIRTIYVKT